MSGLCLPESVEVVRGALRFWLFGYMWRAWGLETRFAFFPESGKGFLMLRAIGNVRGDSLAVPFPLAAGNLRTAYDKRYLIP